MYIQLGSSTKKDVVEDRGLRRGSSFKAGYLDAYKITHTVCAIQYGPYPNFCALMTTLYPRRPDVPKKLQFLLIAVNERGDGCAIVAYNATYSM